MRITLAIDDDVLAAAKEIAAAEQKSVGEGISALARKSMRPVSTSRRTRNSIPRLAVRPDAPRVSSKLVRQLQQDLP
jgi:hypothetical protein